VRPTHLEKQKLCGENFKRLAATYYRAQSRKRRAAREKMFGPIHPPGAVRNGLFAQKGSFITIYANTRTCKKLAVMSQFATGSTNHA
jgi:hypothetical protein